MKNVLFQFFSFKRLRTLKKSFLAVIFLLLQLSAFSQLKSISGIVFGADKVPIPGATVLLKGTAIGSITDSNGKFTLNVPQSGSIIVVSFVGMKPQEITIGNSNVFNVTLSESTVGIDEVVVVGYGTQKKESIVGAIAQVGGTSLVKSGNQTVTNAITGKLSGVFTNQRSGEPGANQAEIIVRGLSSWNSSAPLVLVDGVDRDFKDLDPNEIETISVLKDASATAVFGARGANGVIIVTTKRGTLSKPQLDFSSSYGVSKVSAIPDFVDSYTTMSSLNVALKNNKRFTELIPQHILEEYRSPSTLLNSLRYPNVNWWDVTTKPFAPTFNANFNVRGGTSFTKYFLSLGYFEEGTFFKQLKEGKLDARYWYKRFNYRANADFSLSKSTILSFNLGGELGIKNQPTFPEWKSLYATGPSRMPAYFPEWALELVPDPDYPDEKGIRFANKLGERDANPYTNRMQGSFSRYVDSKLFTDLFLDQKLDFIVKGFSAKGKVSFSTYYKDRDLTSSYSKPDYTLDYSKIGVPGANPWIRSGQSSEMWKINPISVSIGGLESGYYTDLYYEGSLNYGNSFGKHSFSGLVLASRQQKNAGTDFPYYNAAFVGRATYDFANKYLVEINMGYTGSERFAPGNRYGFFPAAAIGWIVSEEPFFRTSFPWIDKFKLRYSDGLVGSDAASSRWLYIADYSASGNFIYESAASNPNAQWEEARKRDIGLEIGIFENKLTFSFDFWDEYRSKMLVTPPGTPLIGNTFKDLNLGSMKKHGIELEVQYNKTTGSGFNYFVKGIFSLNENRVLVKNDAPYAPEYTKQAGKPLVPNMPGDGTFSVLGGTELIDNKYITSVDELHIYNTPLSYEEHVIGDYKYLDYIADGSLNRQDAHPIKGSFYPPFTGSLSVGFSYKNFSFSTLFAGTIGKWVNVSNYFENEFTNDNWRIRKHHLDYWTPVNQNAGHASLNYYSFTFSKTDWVGRGIVDRFWRNSDYIRMKDIYVAYDFKPGFLDKAMGIKALQVYAIGNNLLTFTKLLRDVDPESMRTQDWNNGWYPQTYSGKVGIKLTF